MSRKIAPFIDIVRLEDKETKLKAFIRTVVEQAATSPDCEATGKLTLLVARSIDSPVAKAVAALVREGTISGPVKTILALVPRQQSEAAADDTMAALTGLCGARIVRDVRLFDAHEQLVLGASASWIGDCMRRDPMKRDAYECFAAECTKTAGWARTSFNRLWDICEPYVEEARQPAEMAPQEAALATAASEATEVPGDPAGPNG